MGDSLCMGDKVHRGGGGVDKQGRRDKVQGGGGTKCVRDIWPRLPIPHYHKVLALKGLRTINLLPATEYSCHNIGHICFISQNRSTFGRSFLCRRCLRHPGVHG